MSSFGQKRTADGKLGAGWQVEPRAAAEHPDNLRLLEYWKSLLDGRDMPTRQEFDPTRIPSILHGVYIVEPVGEDDWRYRLVSSGIETRMGFVITGKLASELWDDAMLSELTAGYRHVARQARPQVLRGRMTGIGIDFVDYEGLLLPMLGRDGETRMVISGLFTFN